MVKLFIYQGNVNYSLMKQKVISIL